MTATLRLATVLAAAASLLAAAALPAAAHPDDAQGATNYRSEVTGATGDLHGVEVEVGGGDAYLALEAPEGVEVIVPGYEEPERYLRIEPDGSVYVNITGPSNYLNADRYAEVALPPSATPDAEPTWQLVAQDGRWEWHDHRIHWMSPSAPRHIDTDADRAQHVFDWEIPLIVNGDPVTLTGTLTWLPSPSPLIPIGTAVVIAAAVLAAARITRITVPAAAVAAGAAAAAAATIGAAEITATALTDHAPALIPAVAALILGIVALVRPADDTRVGALVIGALALAVAVGNNINTATSPLLPGPLTPTVAGVLVGVAAGAALAGLVTAAAVMFGSTATTAGEPDPAPSQ